MQYVLVCVLLLVSLARGARMPEDGAKFEPIEKLVTFRLYTRQNPNSGELLTVGDKAKLLASSFKGSLPTVICCHGYFDSENASWVTHIKEGTLSDQELNFVTLDYSKTAKNLLYNDVVNFSRVAGRHAGEFLKFLQTEAKFDVAKAHLIGHSLGAQVLGFTATAFPQKKTIGRISALDPAGPLFENAPPSERLNPDCAKLVDVIHTCRVFVGTKKPVGTVDFYPNGGFNQPGCDDFDLTCNHARSREYFYKTIDKKDRNKYLGRKCETLQDAFNGTCNGTEAAMGYHVTYSSPGIYYLKIE